MRIQYLISLLICCLCISSCSDSDGGDTFIRFTIEDQSYEATNATFAIADLNRREWKFVGLSTDDASDLPAASLQWRMRLPDPMALSGQTILIRNLNDPDMADPIISFRIPGEVTIANMMTTDTNVTITSVSGDIVEGNFRGNNLDYLADGMDKTVNVSGTFRARLLD